MPRKDRAELAFGTSDTSKARRAGDLWQSTGPECASEGLSGVAGEAEHDLTLHVVGQQPTMAGEIAGDLALGAPLLGLDHRIIDATPE
jgi:hypothetical protein